MAVVYNNSSQSFFSCWICYNFISEKPCTNSQCRFPLYRDTMKWHTVNYLPQHAQIGSSRHLTKLLVLDWPQIKPVSIKGFFHWHVFTTKFMSNLLPDLSGICDPSLHSVTFSDIKLRHYLDCWLQSCSCTLLRFFKFDYFVYCSMHLYYCQLKEYLMSLLIIKHCFSLTKPDTFSEDNRSRIFCQAKHLRFKE